DRGLLQRLQLVVDPRSNVVDPRANLVADPRADLEVEDDGKRQCPSVRRAREHSDPDTRRQGRNQILTEFAVVPLLPSFGQSHQDAQRPKHPRNAYTGDTCRSQPKATADRAEHRLYAPDRQYQANGDLDTTTPHISRSAPNAM